MIPKKILALPVLLLLALTAMCQKTWSLEDCITHALNNNVQIKLQQINTLISKQQYNQSIASLFPSVNGSATHVYNNGKTVDMYTNQFATEMVQSNNFYLSSNVLLFNGLMMLNTMKQKQLDFLASKYDLEKVKNDISLTIATAYLQVLYSLEMLEVAKSQLDVTRLQTERTQKLYEAGSVARGTLLTIEAQQAQDELQMVNAGNQLDLAYLTLSQLLDLETTDGFAIEQPSVALPDASVLVQQFEAVYARALEVQPDVKSAELRMLSARKGLSAARGRMSPAITLSGSLGTGYSGASREVGDITLEGYDVIGFTTSGESVYGPRYSYTYENVKFWDQIDRNLNSSFGLSLSIPIFNQLQTYTLINTSKLSLSSAELQLQNTKDQLYKTIQQAWADARAALNRYQASVKSVEALSEAFTYTEQKFNVGMVTSLDFNDAKNNLTRARSEMLQAKYEYVFRIKVLDFYQGKPLTLK